MLVEARRKSPSIDEVPDGVVVPLLGSPAICAGHVGVACVAQSGRPRRADHRRIATASDDRDSITPPFGMMPRQPKSVGSQSRMVPRIGMSILYQGSPSGPITSSMVRDVMPALPSWRYRAWGRSRQRTVAAPHSMMVSRPGDTHFGRHT